MGRSLFAKLHRRFGRRIGGEERRQRAAAHYERLRQAMPVGLIGAPQRIASSAPRVAILGAGFAGVSAAWFAARAGFAVTLIEGGPSYYAPRLTALLPHYKTTHAEFENWPKRIGMGSSCPARGEVTTTQKAYTDLIDGRIAVAGEHTSPGWFGFMEGALESGLVAMARIATIAGIHLPPEYGKFKAV